MICTVVIFQGRQPRWLACGLMDTLAAYLPLHTCYTSFHGQVFSSVELFFFFTAEYVGASL